MSTKPKARKFRIRRSDPAKPANTPAPASAKPVDSTAASVKAAMAESLPMKDDQQMFAPPTDDGFGAQTFPGRDKGAGGAKQSAAAPATPPKNAAEAIDMIRREGLTGRQLRMARRVAQKQGISATSDYDAVRLLREQGIDPFKRANMLDLVVSDAKAGAAKPGTGMQTVGKAGGPGTQLTPAIQKPKLPSTQVIGEEERARDVMDIQRDIARRRRKRATLLFTRLLFFVLLPTMVAGYYYYAVATPMYATKSEFVIQQAESAGGAGGLGGLFSGTGLANSQDSIAVQGYLQSRDAMIRLDNDVQFRDHFSQDHIDPIQRLDADSTQEDAYKKFKKSVKIGYDPTEGIIKMEVIAASPEASATFSEQLIEYAEQQVDQLTARLRGDQMSGARQSRVEAEEKMIAAQEKIVELQEKLGVLSPEAEVQAIFAEVQALEQELTTERLALAQFQANDRPNRAKVNAAENKIATLRELIVEKRALLTSNENEADSLARVSAELQVAQQDLAKRFEFLAAAEAQFEAARLEANRQVRYLSVAVSPVAPDEATYPRAFENTILAFLIFAGIYLMVSLTSSILREQV